MTPTSSTGKSLPDGTGEDVKVSIEKLRVEHLGAVYEMIHELAVFEKMPEGPKLTVPRLTTDLESGAFFGFAALVNDQVVGMALCYHAYSTWEGVFLHLEDLYVRPAFRKHGVGRLLMTSVCREAKEQGYPRVQFNVLKWNPAREFYAKFDAENISDTEDWLSYRLDRDRIAKVADQQ